MADASRAFAISQFDRNPVEDAAAVTDTLHSNGRIDITHKRLLDALQHHEGLRSQVLQVLRAAKDSPLQPGRAYQPHERKARAEEFVRHHEAQLLDLARDAMWDVLGDDGPQGLAADSRTVVHAALLSLLEEQERQRLAPVPAQLAAQFAAAQQLGGGGPQHLRQQQRQ